MNRRVGFLLFLVFLAAVTGYLLSKASFVGRAGISLFYTEYKFLKIWWLAGLLVLVVWLVLFFGQWWAQKKWPLKASRLFSGAAIFLFLLGFYFTYRDFHYNTAHRWLGNRFHLGGYLFWVGCILTVLFFLTQHNKAVLSASE